MEEKTENKEALAIAELKANYEIALQNIAQLLKEKAEIEAKEKELKAQLREAMEKYGVKKFENECVSMTYFAETTSSKIDPKKVRAKHPEIVKECTSISKVSAYVKIQLVGGENGA